MMGFGFDSGGSGGFWMIGGVLLMIGLVVLAVWAIAAINHRGATEAARPTPLDILRERFARGEITQQEFDDARKALGS